MTGAGHALASRHKDRLGVRAAVGPSPSLSSSLTDVLSLTSGRDVCKENRTVFCYTGAGSVPCRRDRY